jgi:hypothetical protein
VFRASSRVGEAPVPPARASEDAEQPGCLRGPAPRALVGAQHGRRQPAWSLVRGVPCGVSMGSRSGTFPWRFVRLMRGARGERRGKPDAGNPPVRLVRGRWSARVLTADWGLLDRHRVRNPVPRHIIRRPPLRQNSTIPTVAMPMSTPVTISGIPTPVNIFFSLRNVGRRDRQGI